MPAARLLASNTSRSVPICFETTGPPTETAGRIRRSHPNRLRHLRPPEIRLSLEATQVDRRHRERAMIQEPAHVLDRLPDVAPELRGRVTEDVHASEREVSLP